MVPPAKKRKLQSADGLSTKRPKSNGTKPASNKSKPSQRRVVTADSLAWESVGEDFGGLQVIRGVDVVRDGDKVQFSVASGVDSDNETKILDESSHDDEGSFEGFGDDPVEGEAVDSRKDRNGEAGVAGKDDQEADRRKGKQAKEKAKAKPSSTAVAAASKGLQEPSKQGNSFGALSGMADDDEGEQEDVDLPAWAALTLSPQILSAVAKLKFVRPTAIQKQTIPEILAGQDVIGKAQTGSGKTLAFGIPIVEKWLEIHDSDDANKERKGPLAVVLSPTRELAKQLGDHMKALCDGLSLAPYVCVVTGGLSIHKQQRQLEKADIVIGTPGRLWEVLEGDINLQDAFTKISFLVVDEADRLFKAGQFKEVEDILGALDKKDPDAEDADTGEGGDEEDQTPRQTLVFSATFDKNLQTKLAGKGRFAATASDEDNMAYLMKCLKFRREPKFIDVNPVTQMAEGLKEGLIECGAMEKVRAPNLAFLSSDCILTMD